MSLLTLAATFAACGPDEAGAPAPSGVEAGRDADAAEADVDASLAEGGEGDKEAAPEVGAEADQDGMAEADTADEESAPDPGVSLGSGVRVWPTRLAPGGTAVIEYRGTLASSANLTLHYGFNGWNSVGGAEVVSADGTGNLDYVREAAMVQVPGDTAYRATIDLPDGARALHFVVYTQSDAGVTWDNNGGQDWNRGVTLPYAGPWIGWRGMDPATAAVVTFHTGHACAGKLEWGDSPSLLASVSETIPVRAHHIALHALPPSTTIYYRVSCGDAERSPLYEFRTAAAHPTAFSFVVFGDSQPSGEGGRWFDIQQGIRTEESDIAFLVCTGDLVWYDRPGHWWTFLDSARDLLATRPLLATPGNHDTSTGTDASFTETFDYEAGCTSESCHSQRYGNAEFFALNSNRPGEFALGTGQQYLWMQSRLAVSTATWRFAFWHVPPYNAGSRHWSEQGTFRDMTGLFDGKVDWVFTGHEHLYQRMKPLRYNAQLAASYGNGPGQGVGYLLVPPAGMDPGTTLIDWADPMAYYRDRLVVPVSPYQQNVVPSENGYVRVDVTGKAIRIRAFGRGDNTTTLPAHELDEVQYTKP